MIGKTWNSLTLGEYHKLRYMSGHPTWPNLFFLCLSRIDSLTKLLLSLIVPEILFFFPAYFQSLDLDSYFEEKVIFILNVSEIKNNKPLFWVLKWASSYTSIEWHCLYCMVSEFKSTKLSVFNIESKCFEILASKLKYLSNHSKNM